MKNIFTVLLVISVTMLWSQTPQFFQYQCVVRDGAGVAVVNQSVNFQISIISGSPGGTVEYTETHSTTTNPFGIATLEIGNGTPVSGSFATISWGTAPHFIKVEADPTGGTTYIDMGTTQLLSVPYALYSEQAGNVQTYSAGSGISISGNVITNEAPDQAVTISSGNGILVTGSYPAFSVENTQPDQAVTLTPGGATTITGTYPNFTISSTDNNTTYTAGSGINVTGTTITNTTPDQTVSLTQGGATTITGTYPNFTISSTDNNTTYTAGTAVNISGTTINNTAPDQTVAITGGGATSVTGTYPNFTISSTDNNTTYTAGTAINISGTTINNTAPDQTVAITGGGATSVTGTYPNFTISSTDLNTGTPGGLDKTVQFNNNGSFGGDTSLVWDNTNKRLGVGTANPAGRMIVRGSNTAPPNEPLFEVKNAQDQTVFVVYPDSVHIYVKDDAAKSNKGGFAVSGRNNAKQITNNFLSVTPDSTRIYTGDSLAGFGVENIGSTNQSYMNITPANYFIGHEAGKNITSGRFNSFIGYRAGYSDTSGNSNYFIGYYSGYNNRSGYSNVFLGDNSGYFNTTGYGNIFLGDHCGYNNVSGVRNVFLGYYAGYSNNGNYNVFLGDHAGFSNTSGWGNTANGYYAFYSNTSGINNVANGYQALYFNTKGNYNVANGYQALYFDTTGNYNVANGYQALYFNSYGSNNVAMGNSALFSNTIGDDNTATGNKALYNNTTGNRNVANGLQALNNNTGGGQNVASGYMALYSNTTGNNNVAVGYGTLFANQTGGNNTALGNNCFTTGTVYTNSTCLGANSAMTQSNKVRLGSATVTVIEGQVAYTFPSDGRFKINVTDEVKGLDFITRLHPVVYNFDTRKFDEFVLKSTPDSIRNSILRNTDYSLSTSIRQTGFIAQEVIEAAKLSGYDFNGVHSPENENDNYSIAYSLLTVPLVKAVQEMNEKDLKFEEEIMLLKQIIIDLTERIEKLENK